MPEVRGSVDDGESVPPDAAEGERGAELDGTVPAEDDREVPCPDVVLDAVGELAGVRGDRLGVEHPVALLPAAAVVAGWYDDAALVRPEPLHQPLLAQRAA